MRGVKWHSGRPVTAENLAWKINHCLDPATGSSVVGLMKGYMLNEIDSRKKDYQGNPVMTTELWDANAIEVKGDRTLVLNLKEAQARPRTRLILTETLRLKSAILRSKYASSYLQRPGPD